RVRIDTVSRQNRDTTESEAGAAGSAMASFELSYDAEEDVLEATFEVFDERFVHALALNDHVFVFSDPGVQAAWVLTLYTYSRLLEVSETEFTGLRDMSEERANAVL